MKRLGWIQWALLAGIIALPVHRPSATAQAAARPAPAAAAATGQIDLNTATVAQLKALPGIGDAYAKRILEGRPYSAKNQLVSRGIVPQATYDKIKDQIIARRAPKP